MINELNLFVKLIFSLRDKFINALSVNKQKKTSKVIIITIGTECE